MKKAPKNCALSFCSNTPHNHKYCDEHKKLYNRRDKQEFKRTDRGKYSRSTWRKLRKKVLKRQPICAWDDCEQPSKDVDHITPRSQGGDDSLENLQGLCKQHHAKKTFQEDVERSRTFDYSSDHRNFGG